jgi:hypothetical protein
MLASLAVRRRLYSVKQHEIELMVSDGRSLPPGQRGNRRFLPAAADRHGLDLEALKAAARSALEAPDRVVTVEAAERA